MRKYLILAFFAAPVTSAIAEDVFVRPESCERIATAQYSDCEVVNHFKCAGTDPVVYWIESVDEDAVLTVETYDQHWGTIDLADSTGEFSVSLTTRTEHPRVALQTGNRRDEFEGVMTVVGSALKMNGQTDFVYDGETLTIAGKPFHRFGAEGAVTASGMAFGTEIAISSTLRGSTIFNDELDLWIEEVSRITMDGEAEEVSELKRLSLPGHEGFGDESPSDGCAQISWLLQPAIPEISS